MKKDGSAPGDTSNVFKDKNHVHSYELKEEADSTCVKDGYKKYVCSTCGNIKQETQEALGHDYSVELERVSSTCVENGYILYKCNRCESTKKQIRGKIEHKFKVECVQEPTCIQVGINEYTCTVCGYKYRDELHLKIHDYDINQPISKVNPTCETDGYVQYKCKLCGEIITNTLNNLGGHNYVESGRDAQYIYYTCKGCGGTKKEYNEQAYTVDMGNGQTDTVTGYYDKEMAAEIFNMLNEYRAEKGLDQLQAGSDALQNAVDIRGYEIAKEFSHTRPNGERALLSFTGSAGCCAENIAKYQSSAEEVMNAWKNSSGHNANMLSPHVKKVSISVFVKCQTTSSGKKAYTYHFVQLFGW